jgi:hypothetical protein
MNPDDRDAIMNLIFNYSYTYDENDIPTFCELFTEDGTWESPLGSAASRAEIFSLLSPRRKIIDERGIQNRHYQTNTILTSISADKASGRTMVLVTWQYPGEKCARTHLTGYYVDEFRKTNSGWRFSKRTLHIDQLIEDLLVK